MFGRGGALRNSSEGTVGMIGFLLVDGAVPDVHHHHYGEQRWWEEFNYSVSQQLVSSGKELLFFS